MSWRSWLSVERFGSSSGFRYSSISAADIRLLRFLSSWKSAAYPAHLQVDQHAQTTD
jgi:hypothetical protein